MTAVNNLRQLKQRLLEQLEDMPVGDAREEIERQINQIDTALNLLDERPDPTAE